MKCWHCDSELQLDFTTDSLEKYYHCKDCEKWYEMSKEKARINGAVPIRFVELDAQPMLPVNVQRYAA